MKMGNGHCRGRGIFCLHPYLPVYERAGAHQNFFQLPHNARSGEWVIKKSISRVEKTSRHFSAGTPTKYSRPLNSYLFSSLPRSPIIPSLAYEIAVGNFLRIACLRTPFFRCDSHYELHIPESNVQPEAEFCFPFFSSVLLFGFFPQRHDDAVMAILNVTRTTQ